MFDSPRSIRDGQILDFDICIAGAGPAGIAMALALEGSGVKVCLLEAGGFEPAPVSEDDPYRGEVVGREYPLVSSRLRFFGGTTNHWGGWCRPLDPIDFVHRPFYRCSGWPISRAQLDPYYPRAAQLCEIDPPGFELSELPGQGRPAEEFFDQYDADLVVKNFRFSPPTRFGEKYRDRIAASRSITCLLDSSLVDIVKPDGSVESFAVRADRKRYRIRAKRFVLAMGGIENARMLLASDRHDPAGIGNPGDWVGRCFADHVGITVGRIMTSDAAPYLWYKRGDVAVMPHLSFRDEFLMAHQLVNFGVILRATRERMLVGPDHMRSKSLFPDWKGSRDRTAFHMTVRFESLPNPASRVELAREVDPNGVRRVKLDWKIDGYEFECLDRIVDLIARKAGSHSLGRVLRIFYDSEEARARNHTTQMHHLGTTRMAPSADQGVVDRDCRVHGTDNLYVAGSSVFPVFGFANPTLTILALALRLADHLRKSGPLASG